MPALPLHRGASFRFYLPWEKAERASQICPAVRYKIYRQINLTLPSHLLHRLSKCSVNGGLRVREGSIYCLFWRDIRGKDLAHGHTGNGCIQCHGCDLLEPFWLMSGGKSTYCLSGSIASSALCQGSGRISGKKRMHTQSSLMLWGKEALSVPCACSGYRPAERRSSGKTPGRPSSSTVPPCGAANSAASCAPGACTLCCHLQAGVRPATLPPVAQDFSRVRNKDCIWIHWEESLVLTAFKACTAKPIKEYLLFIMAFWCFFSKKALSQIQPGNIKWKYILHEAGVSKQILLQVLLAAATPAAGRHGSWSSWCQLWPGLLTAMVAVPALCLCPSHLQLPSLSSAFSQH